MIRSILNRLLRPKNRIVPNLDDEPLPALPQIVLYQFPECPYCVRVLKVIDELSLDIPQRNTRRNREWRDDLKRRTGRTQVPCLFIDGKAMFESLDIVAYLNQHHPDIAKTT